MNKVLFDEKVISAEERYQHIVQIFKSENDFDFQVHNPLSQKGGALSLWLTTIQHKLLSFIKHLLAFYL